MKKSGSVIGGVLLIAGSCIGSGMLALPILTGVAGFIPSLFMLFLAWALMTSTALLLLEVNHWFGMEANLVSMVHKTLGKTGRLVCWLTYLLLFYSILVAYISVSGPHFAWLIEKLTGYTLSGLGCSFFFTVLFGWIVFLGTRQVDYVNRLLMVFKIVAFLLLVVIGSQYVKPDYLLYASPKYAVASLPILVIAFGFQNMIPSLHDYLGGNLRRMRWAIIGGSLLTLAIYLIWEIIALGVLPIDGKYGVLYSYKNVIDASEALTLTIHSDSIAFGAQLFALFAILTSFLAQTLTLSHFLQDGIGKKNKYAGVSVVLSLVPPLFFAILFPRIFYAALNFAGGICAVILFGLLPAIMVWIGRYKMKLRSQYSLFGGKLTIVAIGLFGLFIFLYQLSSSLGFAIFPKP